MTGTDYAAPVEVDPAAPVLTLRDAHAVFRRWLGDNYDLDALARILHWAGVWGCVPCDRRFWP